MPSTSLVNTEESAPIKEGVDKVRVVKTEIWEVSQASLLEQKTIVEVDIVEKQAELAKINTWLAVFE